MRNIIIVVGYPISDIGKGWLAASFASLIPNSVNIKIDPLLEDIPPIRIPESFENENLIHDDAISYTKLGNSFVAKDQEFLMGNVIRTFLKVKPMRIGISPKDIPKRTWDDIAYGFAEELTKRFSDKTTLIVEVGGSPDDKESNWIAQSFRYLRNYFNIKVYLVLLTIPNVINIGDNLKIKMRNVYRGIILTKQVYYDIPFGDIFIRDMGYTISHEYITKLGFKTGLSSKIIHTLPEVSTLKSLPKALLRKSSVLQDLL